MPTIVQGELTRHHNQPFYAQPKTPKFFWMGCLIPVLFMGLFGALIIRGATTEAGTDAIRGFLLIVIAVIIVQVILGGGLFWKKRSSLALGLLLGGGVMFLLLILALIAVASIIGSFIQ